MLHFWLYWMKPSMITTQTCTPPKLRCTWYYYYYESCFETYYDWHTRTAKSCSTIKRASGIIAAIYHFQWQLGKSSCRSDPHCPALRKREPCYVWYQLPTYWPSSPLPPLNSTKRGHFFSNSRKWHLLSDPTHTYTHVHTCTHTYKHMALPDSHPPFPN